MAIAIPHKPRYRDRTLPIYYLVDDRMLLRRRPTQVHDPRTPAQQRQRLRLRVASRFLKGFRPMVAEGFAPEELDNLRRVGAYQQALGRFWLTDADALAATICAAFNRRVRDINRPRLMETAARLYPLAPRLGDWLTRRFFSKK